MRRRKRRAYNVDIAWYHRIIKHKTQLLSYFHFQLPCYNVINNENYTARKWWRKKEEHISLTIVFPSKTAEVEAEASLWIGTARVFSRINIVGKVVTQNCAFSGLIPPLLPQEVPGLLHGEVLLPGVVDPHDYHPVNTWSQRYILNLNMTLYLVKFFEPQWLAHVRLN